MKKYFSLSLLCVLIGILLAFGNAHAGGLYLYEVGSPDVGLAAAGYAARAQDASTALTNPAGMTRIDRPSLMLGAQPMYMKLDFSTDNNTDAVAGTLPGGGAADEGDSNGWMPAGGLFYVHPVNDKVAFGLAIAGYFGMALDYQNDWVGRYYAQEATLQTIAIQPAVSYKITDQLSVGVGVAAHYGTFDDKVAIDRRIDGLPDGKLELEDEDWAVQFNLGVLYEPTKGTRLGLTWRSEAELDFKDQPEFSNFGPTLEGFLNQRDRSLDLGMNLPQAVMFSFYYEINDNLALLANLGWEDWSEFGKVEVGTSGGLVNPSLTTDMDYKDTWHAALGTQYQFSEPLRLTAGIAYDSAMLDKDQVSPSLPVGEAWRFALGSIYNWSKDLTIGGAYELVWGGDLDMDVDRGPLAGRVSGTYESVAIHVISLNAEWRF